MKAFVTVISLIAIIAMGTSLYGVFKKAPQYQAESAQHMKQKFLESGAITVQSTNDQVWTFSEKAEDWVFSVKGPKLEVRPPVPTLNPASKQTVNVQDLPAWPEIQTSLVDEVKQRLQIPPKSSAEVEVLPPAAPTSTL